MGERQQMDSPVKSVDPFRCRVWSMHGRQEEDVDEASCAEEIKSIKECGQRNPAAGRTVHDDPDCDVEIITGTRRLFIARHLKISLIVAIREFSDLEAIVEMEIENRLRKDLSPYERGMSYARWLRGKYFTSQEELANKLHVSASQVSRLLTLAHLPTVILNAFGKPVEIREGWGVKLMRILEDPARRDSTIRAARHIAARSERSSASEVYRELMASAAPTVPGGRKTGRVLHDQVVAGEDGTPLFKIRHHQDEIALLLPMDRTSASTLDAIQRAVADILIASTNALVPSTRHSGGLQRAMV